MALIECRGLRKDYSGTRILESVDLAIHPGEKVGLIGSNGAGKTTLLNAITGVDDDFRGGLVRQPGLRIGYLSQHIEPAGEETALEYLTEEASVRRLELRTSEEGLSEASKDPAAMRAYERALERYEAAGGDFAEERASRALSLVGLKGREGVRAASLSGGERGILALARAIQGKPDLLILDEPGNHLDFWGLAWLEDFLSSLPEAAIIVSHNRMLLDRTVTRILELEGGKVLSFGGDYSSYRLEKLRRASCQGEDWQASKKKIARLEEMVRKAAVMAAAFTKHQAKSNGALGQKLRARRRQLEREKEAAVARPELGSSSIVASFAGRGAADAKSDYALIVRDYSRSFGDIVLFEKAGFDVLRGERVALIGPNGCGKTTFLRDLASRGAWDSDDLRLCPSMRLGLMAQDRDGFARGRTIREEFERMGAREAEIRALLRDFGFGRRDPDAAIDKLSGGELNRLQLARAIFQRANFLVLDEPTNHLDIDARESVEDRLQEYDGTLLVVSHDRYFIEKVADRIVFVKDRRFEAFEGSFSEFWVEAGASLRPGAVDAAGKGRDGLDRAKALDRARKRKPSAAEAELELRIAALEEEKSGLETRIKAAFDKRDFASSRSLANELQELHAEIERLYAAWS